VDSRTVNTLAGNSPASSTQVSKPSANPFNIPTGLKPGLAGKRPAAPSAGGTKHPLRQAINDFTSNLNNLADSITNGPKKKPSDAEAPSASPAGSAAPSSNN